MVHPKAFQLAAGRIDKLSGDIRVCFEIMRMVIQRKIDTTSEEQGPAETRMFISIEDAHSVIQEMFESKVTKIIQKVPRSHLILLSVIADIVSDSDKGQLTELSTVDLVKEYNRKATQLVIDRINIAEVHDIVHSLEMSDIVQYSSDVYKKLTAVKRKSFALVSKQKSLKIMLKCELRELEEALQRKINLNNEI